MPVHHPRMLGRHRACNYNRQDTVLAQLSYHLHTAHINASVSRVGTTLVYHRCPPLSCNRTIGPQRWFNAGAMLLVCIMNKTLAQHWVNAYNSFHLYINIPFFGLTSRIDPSCQTDAVLITANKLKRDDSRALF